MCESSSTIAVCSKREVWWLISALNAVHLALFPQSITAALSHKPPNLRLSARVTLAEGVGRFFFIFFIFEGRGQTHRQMSPHVLVCKHVLSPSHTITPMHRLHLFPFLLACLILSRTSTQHSLTSPGIWSFYRASVCWRGQWYGRAVSPSSDWISDQYPVPCRPASSGQADRFWKPVLVV